MAIGTLTMILANVGLSILNNWAGSRQNEKIAKKREEFERAAREGQRDRMLQLMRDGQALTLELEEQKHQERLKELNDQFDNLINELAYNGFINQWPLKTLPIVMKNQALGNLLAKQEEKVALHCILTPCNRQDFTSGSVEYKSCDEFNQYILPKVENALEEYCNLHWSTLSGNPVLFYSGAWKADSAPTGTQISSLQTSLRNLPCLLISPYFRPTDGRLTFHVRTWGVGSTPQDIFTIPEIEPTEFQNVYTNKLNWLAKFHLIEETVEDLVPYLQCMIGYIADTYFWSAFGSIPKLPQMLTDGIINTDGMKYLITDSTYYYYSSIDEIIGTEEEYVPPFYTWLDYYRSISTLLSLEEKKICLERILFKYCKLYHSVEVKSIHEFWTTMFFDDYDTDFIESFIIEYFDVDFINAIEISTRFNIQVPNNIKDSFPPDLPLTKTTSMKELSTEQYSLKRNELVELVDSTLEISDLPAQFANDLSQIRKKSLENQFNIVLVAGFQGGKSTTFNAFCGGREISRRGDMTKTSATVITATNLSDKNQDEYAIVEWKSDYELLLSIESLLKKRIHKEDTDYSPETHQFYTPSKYLHLNNPKHVEVIKNAIEAEKSYLAKHPSENDDARQICRMADVLLSFYNNPEIQRITRKEPKASIHISRYTIDEVYDITTFPKKWETQFKTSEGVNGFSYEEVLFAFVKKVSCYIHSQNLERLGCSITDCPGLFASAWDTFVTLENLRHADAVLYLLNGEKAMGAADVLAITKISQDFEALNLKEKIFFAINMQKPQSITRNILENNISKLSTIGFENVIIHQFHALLFFLHEFGKNYLQNSVEEKTVARFLELAKRFGIESESIEDCWTELADDCLHDIRNRTIEIEDLSSNSVDGLSNVCKNKELFGAMEQFIISKKAYSILVEQGANMILDYLNAYIGSLTNVIEGTTKDVNIKNQEFIETENIFQNFKKQATLRTSNIVPDYTIRDIATRGYQECIGSSEILLQISLKLVKALAPVLTAKCKLKAVEYKALSTLNVSDWTDKKQKEAWKELKGIIEPVVNNCLSEEIGGRIQLWTRCMFDGQNEYCNERISPNIQDVSKDITKMWNSFLKGNKLIKSVSLNLPSTTPSGMSVSSTNIRIHSNDLISGSADVATTEVISDVVATIAQTIGWTVVTTAIYAIFDGLFTFGLSSLFGAILLLLSTSSDTPNETPKTRDDLTKAEKKLFDVLYPVVMNTFTKDKIKDEVQDSMKEAPQKIISIYKNNYIKEINDKEMFVKGEIAHLRELSRESTDKQLERARIAKDQRDKIALPKAHDVTNYINSLG